LVTQRKKCLPTSQIAVVVFSFLLLLVLWQLIVSLGHLPKWLLPSPFLVGKTLVTNSNFLMRNTLVTLMEALLGLGLALLLAVPLAIVMDAWAPMRRLLYPWLLVSQTIPMIALAPLFLLWLGYGLLPKVLVVTLVCFFPLAMTLLVGFAGADEEMLSLLAGMGAGRWQQFRLVKLPGALPSFFGGLRISVTYSLMGAVIGEWLGATHGLGVVLVRAQKAFRLEMVFAAIIIIVVVSMLLFLLARYWEIHAMPWLAKEEEEWPEETPL